MNLEEVIYAQLVSYTSNIERRSYMCVDYTEIVPVFYTMYVRDVQYSRRRSHQVTCPALHQGTTKVVW